MDENRKHHFAPESVLKIQYIQRQRVYNTCQRINGMTHFPMTLVGVVSVLTIHNIQKFFNRRVSSTTIINSLPYIQWIA